MAQHALLSASAAHRWMRCPGSIAMEKANPRESTKYAEEGTLAHDLAAGMLLNMEALPACPSDMVLHVGKYVDAVKQQTVSGGLLFVEQRVDYSHIVNYPDSFGTSDAIVVLDDEIQVHDLKYGMGVQVSAERNEQLMLYALGALKKYEHLADYKRVRLFIHQVRISPHASEWDCTIEELLEFGRTAAQKAGHAIACLAPGSGYEALIPGDKQCKFCDARGVCPALAEKVRVTIVGKFDDLTAETVNAATQRVKTLDNAELAEVMKLDGLIETWLTAVRSTVETKLLSGESVPGYKLVEGRLGARKWIDKAATEAFFKQLRMKKEDMYNLELISPTDAEKKFKDSPVRWNKIAKLITRSEGKPSVAPMSDKRPALVVNSTADAFSDLDASDKQGE